MKKFSSITKGSYRRSSSNHKVRNTILIAIIVVAILLWIVPSFVRFSVGLVMQPVTAVQSWLLTSEAGLPNYLRTQQALRVEISGLKDQLAAMSTRDEYVSYLESEILSLQSLIGRSERRFIGAAVLQQPPRAPYDVLVVDQGSRDGVMVGAAVYGPNQFVIGTVAHTYSTQSVVKLISAPGADTTVYIYGPDIYVTARGEGNGVVKIGVPQGIALTEGQPVVAAAFLGGQIGTISSIDTAPSRPEQFAYVTLPTPLQTLRYVAIDTVALTPLTFDEAKAAVDANRAVYTTVAVPEGVLVDIQSTSTATSTTATSSESI